ncbi:MAG: GNAT family N-acetyltransferase [Dehalococcoidia bacterium]|nr:GNAT family N-acetyltransferase [Dehalococcoidia bacterium]
MPMLTQTLGVLLAPPTGEKYERRLSREMEVLRALVDAIPPFKVIAFNCHYSFTNWLPFYWDGYTQTTRYTYVIEDTSDLDAVWSGMGQAVRTEIRKAEKNGIEVVESDNLDEFWRLNSMTWERQGRSVPYTRSFLEHLDETCSRHAARTIFIAKDCLGRVHSALYVVYDNKAMYNLMQGGDPALRSSGANPLAMWRSIQLAAERGIRYDFEGSMLENVEPFFRHFGARQKPYFRIWKDKRPLWVKTYQYLRAKAGHLARAIGLRR